MTIDQIKSAADTNVRQKTVANSVTRDEVADLFDNLADEQRDRGMYGVDTTAGLAAVSGANYRKVAVGDTGIFEWASTGTANGTTIFAASGGGVWILKMAIPKGALASLNSIDYTTNLITNKPDLTSKADLVGGKVPSAQLPSYVDDVLEYANLAAFPGTGEAGKIYIAIDSGFTYRWTGSVYAQITGGGGGGGGTLNDLTDVVISSPSTSQILQYNGTNWINSNIANSYTLQTLTDAATINWEFNGNPAKVTIASNRILSVNILGGGVNYSTLEVVHTNAGTTLALPGNSSRVSWSTGAGETTLINMYHNGTSFIWYN